MNRQWLYAKQPHGKIGPDTFQWTETAIPTPRDGEVLVIDVRPREEYDVAHLPFARSMPVAAKSVVRAWSRDVSGSVGIWGMEIRGDNSGQCLSTIKGGQA